VKDTRSAGAEVTLEELDVQPHAVHHRLRATEPVAWLPCLEGWLITGHAPALTAMRDADAFTVDDPRFSTAQVIGPSMLSLDGEPHVRHRAPFVAPFRAAAVQDRFTDAAVARARALIAGLRPAGGGELRRGFAGPLAAAIVANALGMAGDEVDAVLADYDQIVVSVTAISAGQGPTAAGATAASRLRGRLEPVIDGRRGDSLLADAARAGGAGGTGGTGGTGGAGLGHDEIAANAAVLLFGGIETTEGMITNALREILSHSGELERVRNDPGALDGVIDESLRREPAAAVIDRYATRDIGLAGAQIARGDLVRISLAGANRDPAVFPDPDRYDPARTNARRHLAFAQGPHVCVGVHLARLEARAALAEVIALPGLRLDPARPSPVRGLIFRKSVRLDALWDTETALSRGGWEGSSP
jgi:cytochrome P450